MEASDVIASAKRIVGYTAAVITAALTIVVLALVYWLLLDRAHLGWFLLFAAIISASSTSISCCVARKNRRLVFREVLVTRSFLHEVTGQNRQDYEHERSRLLKELAKHEAAKERALAGNREQDRAIKKALSNFGTLMPREGK